MSDPSTAQVRRAELHETRLATTPSQPLSPGQVRLAIDSFGITANNITYAVYGDRMSYWNFFPAPDGDEWGVVPVWGFADIAESTVEDLEAGERIYGYLPMAGELIVEPARIRPGSFVDATEHRRALPAVYNSYTRCAADPSYDPALEDAQMLLRPLFFTSFLIDDFLAAEEFFGAEQIVLTSASSKTAFGTAHLLHQRKGVKVVGLTSAGNVSFVEGLGCYDEVVPYGDIESLPELRTVAVDFAGNADVIRAIHERFGDHLAYSSVIGGTHWEASERSANPLPGPNRVFFFAPTQVERRVADWGMPELERRLQVEWDRFVPLTEQWLDIEHSTGLESAMAVYADVLAGRADPSVANVIKLTASG